MAQRIISAPPKTGKTMYVIQLIFSILHKNPERLIVTNIIGIDIPGVVSVTGTLHKPLDWRDYPNGTVVIYDEAHEHPAFSKDDLIKDVQIDESRFDEEIQKINNNNDLLVTQKKELISEVNKRRKWAIHQNKEQILDIARGLTLHGHFGFDIYFITQDIRRMNDIALAATNEHIILRRLFNWPLCIVYKFAEVQRSFNGTSRRNAISIGFYLHKKYLHKFYISGEYHNNTKTAPWMIIFLIFLVFAIFFGAYSKMKSANAFGLFSDKKEPHKELSSSVASPVVNPPTDSVIAKKLEVQEQVRNCIVQTNRSLEECRSLYDQDYINAKHNTEVQQKNREQSIVHYDPAKPYDFDNSQLDYKASNKPVFSGCIKYGKNKYKAYTQQGTLLNVDSSVCKKLIEDGERPFDYFGDRQKQNNNATGAVAPDLDKAKIMYENKQGI